MQLQLLTADGEDEVELRQEEAQDRWVPIPDRDWSAFHPLQAVAHQVAATGTEDQYRLGPIIVLAESGELLVAQMKRVRAAVVNILGPVRVDPAVLFEALPRQSFGQKWIDSM